MGDDLYQSVEKAQQYINTRQEAIGILIEDMDEIAVSLSVAASMNKGEASESVQEMIERIATFVSTGEDVVESLEILIGEGADIAMYHDGPPEEAEGVWMKSWLRRASIIIESQG